MGSEGGTPRERAVREWAIPTVGLMTLGALTAVVWVQVPMRYALLDIMLPVAFASLIVWKGLTLRGRLALEDLQSVGRWFAGGMVLMGTLGLWPVVLEQAGQTTVPVGVRLLTELIAGGLFGLLVGVATVKARSATEAATEARVERELHERQRKTNDLLNRTLRHQLLNSLTVVRGRAELLADRTSADAAEWAETVVQRTDAMTETVDEIAHITRSLTDGTDLERRDLQAVVAHEVARARETHPTALVLVEDVPACQVRADDLLERALANVIENAIEHNRGPRPTVSIDGRLAEDRVVLTVSDDGPGIPPAARERVLDANERGLESDGDGLGLFLTVSVLQHCGGDISLGESDLGGTAVDLAVPLADAGPTASRFEATPDRAGGSGAHDGARLTL